MPLMDDIKGSFEKKGLVFVSLTEANGNRDKSILTYKDASGTPATREVDIRLTDLEEVVMTIDSLDPGDLANFLLN
jgi:hypothetical protein